MFELLCNIFLWFGLLYAYCFNVLEAPVPDRVARNPYTLKPDIWPSVIIILLLICVAVNIINIIRKNRDNPAFGLDAPLSVRIRMLLGICIIVGASFILEPLGYMATCFLLLFFYGLLLGERHVIRLFIVSVLITLVLYVVFSVLLSVNLPRGTIPEMREFALYIELLVAQAKAAMGLL